MPWQSERRQSFRSCSGGLISYGPNFPDLWRCAGDYVDKILLGAKPDDIPVEQPTKFDLVINLTMGKRRLDLRYPPQCLLVPTRLFNEAKRLFALLASSAAAWPRPVQPQAATKLHRFGIIDDSHLERVP